MPGATAFDRILVIAVATLIALFTFGTVSALVSSATAGDVSVNRDDQAVEVESVDEDNDDDPRDRFRDGSRDGSRDNSGRDSRDSESNSRTGTTRGTGQSRSRSNSR
jgi:hypothetical protein